jgi:molecular chaperone HscC
VDVRFSYDMNGVLDVDATIVSTGKTATFTIESGGRMSKKQLEEARARLARLKFHPRDALPNVTALARADALFVELVGQDRARLGAYIASFRGAMDRQDRAAIEAERESLRRITAELESQHRGPRP